MGKKTVLLTLAALLLAGLATMALAYGEGPSDSGRWACGQVTYSDGSKCRRCCSDSLETPNDFSKEGCTDSDAAYKIYIASDSVIAVYSRGSRVWSGSRSARGGARVDILAR